MSLFTLSYFKKGIAQRFKVFDIKRFNPGEGWRELGNILDEDVEISIFAFGIDKDPLFVVEDPSPDGIGFGKTVDKGPEPDSLNDAGNLDLRPLHYLFLTLF